MKKIFIISMLLIFQVTFLKAEYLTVSGNFSKLDELYSSSNLLSANSIGDYNLENELVFSGRVRGLGRFTAYFDVKKNFKFTNKSEGTLYLQGELVFRKNYIALATARIEQLKVGYKVHVEVFDEGKLRKIRRPFRLVRFSFETNENASVKSKRLWRGKKYANLEKGCGTAHSLGAHKKTTHGNVNPSNTLKQVSIIIEGDTELQNKGKNLSSYLATMMNMVDTWYKRDLGVTYNTTIVSAAANYSSSVEYDENTYEYYLHHEMRSKRPASSRSEYIHYLVTGKNPVGNSNGLAGVVPDLGTICKSKSNSIGFTIHYSDNEDFNYETTAHEVGHLFAAEHDDATTGNVGYMMNSGTTNVSEYLSEFSNMSKNQVANHLNSHSSCVSDSDGGGNDPDDGGGSNPGDGDDDDIVEDITYGITLKHKKRRRRMIVRVSRSDGVRRVGRMYYEIYCGYNTDDISEYLTSKSTNRRGRSRVRYRTRQTPSFCQAILLDENDEVIAVSNILSNVGRKEEFLF